MFGIEAAFTGRLGRDPEAKMVKGGTMAMTTLAVAVDEAAKPGEESKSTWVAVKLFGDRATLAAESFVKGDVVYVEGKLSLDTWTGKDGAQRSGLSLLANEAKPLGKIGNRRPKSEGQHHQHTKRGSDSDQHRRAAAAQAPLDRYTDMPNDPLPF